MFYISVRDSKQKEIECIELPEASTQKEIEKSLEDVKKRYGESVDKVYTNYYNNKFTGFNIILAR